jgi:hypothetical protein
MGVQTLRPKGDGGQDDDTNRPATTGVQKRLDSPIDPRSARSIEVEGVGNREVEVREGEDQRQGNEQQCRQAQRTCA